MIKLLLLVILGLMTAFDSLAKDMKEQCGEGKNLKSVVVQFRKPSLFGDVLVVDSGTKRYLRFGDICGADQSSIDISEPDKVVMEYVRHASMSLVYAEQHKNILVVGMGGGVFSNLLERVVRDIKIDAIEIDPVVVEVAKEYFGVKPTKNYRIHIRDAVDFISHTDKLYDIIFLDAYDSDGIPERLKNKSFFRQVSQLLNPGGVVVANFGLDSPRVYLQLANRMRETFGETKCLHGKEESNLVVIAGSKESIKTAKPVREAIKLDNSLSLPYSLSQMVSQVRECPQI